jgi:hypothetical protein
MWCRRRRPPPAVQQRKSGKKDRRIGRTFHELPVGVDLFCPLPSRTLGGDGVEKHRVGVVNPNSSSRGRRHLARPNHEDDEQQHSWAIAAYDNMVPGSSKLVEHLADHSQAYFCFPGYLVMYSTSMPHGWSCCRQTMALTPSITSSGTVAD